MRRFDAFLRHLGHDEWSAFYDLAADKAEICIHRPFYPHGAGGKAQAHLFGALGLTSMDDLLRDCEKKTSARRAACSLFWTLGANQVGRAAISGWRELIAPALAAKRPRTALWPFHGSLPDLLESHDCVIAETYPAEGYAHLRLSPSGKRWSKRDPAQRLLKGATLQAWAAQHGIELTPALRRQLEDGFGRRADGEDAFDAAVGVLSMLGVVLELRPDGAPDTPIVRHIEGWILGQECEARL